MKVRIKFSKHGAVRYIGHLDIMRYFQKSMRKSGVDIAYSTGYSPHQIMSFAQPLGVGMESDGEYLDIEMASEENCEDIRRKLNSVMVPGIVIENVVALPDDAGNAMASVAAAKYKISLKSGDCFNLALIDSLSGFLDQNEIFITKETKKNTMIVDIKPGIYEASFDESGINFTCFLDASSGGNIKAITVIKALCDYCKIEFKPLDYMVCRLDTYANKDGSLVPLDKV